MRMNLHSLLELPFRKDLFTRIYKFNIKQLHTSLPSFPPPIIIQLVIMSAPQDNDNNAPFSLIKYEAEIEISDNVQEYEKAKSNRKALDSNPSPQDVLNSMILPRDWKAASGKHFMQYVSHQKSERSDVVRLKESLDEALEHRQARIEGICPIREELFAQAFDEIIREVTINCPERGLLLMRVRDEHIMTLAAYQTLYHSSTAFGMRKLLEAEEGMDELGEVVRSAEEEHNQLQRTRTELLSKKESLEKKIAERKAMESEEREDQLIQIQEQERALNKFLTSLKEPAQ